MKNGISIGRLIGIVLFALLGACATDDEASCTSLCNEATAGGCNTFDLGQGSCAADCALAQRLSDKAGCQAETTVRLDCEAAQANVCDPGCDAENMALVECGANFCVSNLTDPDCEAALAAIQ